MECRESPHLGTGLLPVPTEREQDMARCFTTTNFLSPARVLDKYEAMRSFLKVTIIHMGSCSH